jgi:predicted extracellular nuclease
MRVNFRVNDEDIHLYGVHLKSERGFSEADGQRIAQASIVCRHHLPLLEAGEHVIVAGDLNDKRGDPILHRIRGRDDIGPDLVQVGNCYWNSKKRKCKYWDIKSDRWTYEFRGKRNQIDHILPSVSLRNGMKSSVHTPTGFTGDKPITDHRALIVDFKI